MTHQAVVDQLDRLVTELEHHSNFVPWQYVAQRTGARFEVLPVTEAGELRLDLLDGIDAVKVVATNLVSNALGTINDVQVSAQMIEASAAARPPLDRETVGLAKGWVAAREALARERLGETWRAFQSLEPYWQ